MNTLLLSEIIIPTIRYYHKFFVWKIHRDLILFPLVKEPDGEPDGDVHFLGWRARWGRARWGRTFFGSILTHFDKMLPNNIHPQMVT